MPDLTIHDHAAGATLQVKVKPRSSRSAVVQITDGILVVALAAPPVDGEANAELLRFVASVAHLPKSSLRLASGEKSRLKTLQFLGLSPAAVRTRLEGLVLTKR